jgi:hypothetical protein
MDNPSLWPVTVEDLLLSVGHLSEAEQFDALHRHIAMQMAEADNFVEAETWVQEAFQHLKDAACGAERGGVEVSASALHLVLGYVEFLEGRHVADARAGER